MAAILRCHFSLCPHKALFLCTCTPESLCASLSLGPPQPRMASFYLNNLLKGLISSVVLGGWIFNIGVLRKLRRNPAWSRTGWPGEDLRIRGRGHGQVLPEGKSLSCAKADREQEEETTAPRAGPVAWNVQTWPFSKSRVCCTSGVP
jgi:hypothetical protein